jgi:hypothetical protein
MRRSSRAIEERGNSRADAAGGTDRATFGVVSLNITSQRKGGLLQRIARWVGGIALILVGLVFAFPGIPGPGLLLIVFGVMVLMPESRWLRKKYARLKHRYPRVFAMVEKWLRRRRPRRRAA